MPVMKEFIGYDLAFGEIHGVTILVDDFSDYTINFFN